MVGSSMANVGNPSYKSLPSIIVLSVTYLHLAIVI
jgi:hypothetical protein